MALHVCNLLLGSGAFNEPKYFFCCVDDAAPQELHILNLVEVITPFFFSSSVLRLLKTSDYIKWSSRQV